MANLRQDICRTISRYLKSQPFDAPLSPRGAVTELRSELPVYEISDEELEDAVVALAISRGYVLFYDLSKLSENSPGSSGEVR